MYVQLGSKYASLNITLYFLEEHSLRKLMKFCKVLAKEKKIESVRVKDKSCNSLEDLQLYQNKTPNIFSSPAYSKSFRDVFL